MLRVWRGRCKQEGGRRQPSGTGPREDLAGTCRCGRPPVPGCGGLVGRDVQGAGAAVGLVLL
jgi:hypothetical protein